VNAAWLEMQQSDFAESDRLHRQAIDVRRRLADDLPAELELRTLLAETIAKFAVSKLARGQAKASLEPFAESLAIYERVEKSATKDVELRFASGAPRMMYAQALRECGETRRAEAEIRRALETVEKALADRPDSPARREHVGNARNMLAIFHSDAGRHAEAEKELDQAIAIYEGLIREDPQHWNHHSGLGNALTNRARARAGLGKTFAAAGDLAKAGIEQATAVRLQGKAASLELRRGLEQIGGFVAPKGDGKAPTKPAEKLADPKEDKTKKAPPKK
ncbi:MAG TPA: tetratricopeptide repeat protein, partial [Planctomycetia bacterium]|nr:tetratricopeptide repeat protein [Planctomycetia bacterium]